MAKKTISKIAALALAGATVASTFAMSVSALTNQDGIVDGTIYGVTTTTTVNGVSTPSTVYYTTIAAAKAAGNGSYDSVNLTSIFGYGKYVYVNSNCVISDTDNGGTKYTTTSLSSTVTTPTHTIPTSYRYSSNTVYYSSVTDTWYPNLESLKAATKSTAYTASKTSSYTTEKCWFDPESGEYYTKSLSVAFDNAVYISQGTTTPTSTDATSVYQVGSKYYPTYASAYSAANGKTSLITWVSDYTVLPTNYFSNVTGKFYNSYAAAFEASNRNSNYVVTFNDSYYDYYYNYLYGYDYYDYLYGYYNYDDPSYYYWLNKYYGSSSSSNKDTTTATVGNRKGWTNISNYLKKVSNGSSVTVDMNKETEVPSSVLSAIDGRNVTVKFVLDNGVTFTVNGKDVASAKDVELDTTYNTKNISNKLIKAAYKKNDAVSSAQISIDEGSFGFTSDVTVKFNTKRAGYKAKLYRYNSSKNTLSLVDSATIGSNGKCTFDGVTKGGEFLIVLYK